MSTELLLIDLSSIAHPIWHAQGNQPDPDYVSNAVVARVHALASQHPHAAVCCDSGKSFRNELSPPKRLPDGKWTGYKANRQMEDRAPLNAQIAFACERLKADGFPVWSAVGFEADDIIATATAEALKIDPDVTVLIATGDKDLLQLVSDRVRVKKIHDGAILTPAEVKEKFRVNPSQMLDLLTLAGDTSDGVIGAERVGLKIAADLLIRHGSIQGIYDAMARGVVPGITPVLRTNLQEFKARWPLTRELIALRADVPIPFAEISAEREAKPMETNEHEILGPDSFGGEDYPSEVPLPESKPRELPPTDAAHALNAATARVAERINRNEPDGMGVKVAPSQPKSAVLDPVGPSALVPLDFSQQLEPRTIVEAKEIANILHASKLFGAYGSPQAVFSVVLAGRELGMPAMAALRAFHIIEGKPTLSAGAIQSLVLKSGKASYFRCSERTDTRATFVTKRGEDPEMALSFTVDEARRVFGFDVATDKERAELQRKWDRSGWGKNPADMLVARASSKLARLVYPDVVSGLYAPEEIE